MSGCEIAGPLHAERRTNDRTKAVQEVEYKWNGFSFKSVLCCPAVRFTNCVSVCIVSVTVKVSNTGFPGAFHAGTVKVTVMYSYSIPIFNFQKPNNREPKDTDFGLDFRSILACTMKSDRREQRSRTMHCCVMH